MAAFYWTILVGGIGTGGADGVAKAFEKALNFGVGIEFTTLVEENIFIFAGGCMMLEKMTQPVNG